MRHLLEFGTNIQRVTLGFTKNAVVARRFGVGSEEREGPLVR